ncbi:hypothetical protein SRHO_G00230870 [Serrasalmus rhombeus]
MDSVLRDLPFLFVYLDDILVASSSPSEHLSHLHTLFERLTEHGLIINPAKCEFGLSTIDFLGHRVTQDGVVPLPSKVEAITTFPRPVTVRALQEFLGMVNFYHRFFPRAAQTMRPLYEALKGGKPKHTVDWSPDRDKAFVDAKAALAKAAMLAHPASSAPVALTTDASDYAVGAVYEQWVGNAWQPLVFFSRQLRPSERKYSTFDRELLGVYLAIRHFRFLLEGRQFTVFVDHKPLTFAMSKVTQPWASRQQRQLTYISEFTTDIAHLSGKHNYVADCLSRAVVGAVHLGLDYGSMAAEQATDPDVQACRSSTSGLRLQDDHTVGRATLQRSSLLDNARLFTPLPTSCHGLPSSHVPSGLQSAGFVFIRVDGHRRPLRPPYEGPFRVVETGDKHFVVDIGGKPECISVDRLKPVHLDLAGPVELAQPPKRGRPLSRPPFLFLLPLDQAAGEPRGQPLKGRSHPLPFGRAVLDV